MGRRLRVPKLVVRGARAEVVTHEPTRPRVGRRPDAERLAGEPWRKAGYGSAYRKARQRAIASQGGRCADCGRQVAERRPDGSWSCSGGGQVHHERALAEGGGHDAANLVLLCPSCHAKRDEARRRAAKREPGG